MTHSELIQKNNQLIDQISSARVKCKWDLVDQLTAELREVERQLISSAKSSPVENELYFLDEDNY